MRLITNSVDTDRVEETVIDGDRYLIAKDVTFLQPQRLAGGYVPASHVANSAPDWDGEPLGVNHPRDDSGRVVSFNSPEGQRVTVGHARNPERKSDGSVSADLAVNADQAVELGGEAADIVEALENGDPLEVSSQYFADPLPPGVYDGQYREQVEGNLDPDGIALLPNKKGVCSLPDCGFDPAGKATANSDQIRLPVAPTDDGSHGSQHPEDGGSGSTMLTANVTVGGVTFEGTDTGTLEEADIPDDDFEPHYVFDGETKSESSFPLVDAEGQLRRGNVAAAFRFRDDVPDSDDLLGVLSEVNDRFEDPPIAPESLDEAVSANSDGLLGNVLSFLGLGGHEQTRDEPAESGTDSSISSSGMPRANGRRLAATLTSAINDAIGDETDRSEVVAEMADAAGIQPGTVNNILNREIECPPQQRLSGFAEVLPVDEDELVTAAEADGCELSANSRTMKNRQTLINEITSNSAITEESLADACDDRVEKIHEDVMAEDDGGGDGGSDDDGDAIDVVANRLDEIEDKMVTEDDLEDVVANADAQSRKQDLAEEIVANSAEYEDAEAVLEDYPTANALEAKRETLDTGTVLPGTGATANADVGGDEDDWDVGSGVVGGDD